MSVTPMPSRLRSRWWLPAALVVAAGVPLAFWVRGESPERAWSAIEGDVRERHWAQAEERLARWVRRSPRDGQAWLKLGAVRALQGRDDEALAAFAKVEEPEAAGPVAQLQVGEIWMKRHRPEPAERAFRNAAARDPKSVDSRRRLVFLLTVEERGAEARAFLWELYRLTHDQRQLVTLVGLSTATDPNGPDLDAELREFLKDSPDDPWLQRARGARLLRAGKPSEARPYLESAARVMENDPAGRTALAECLFALGDLAAAESLLGEPAEGGESAASWLLRGELAEARGAGDGALDCWRRALQLDPENRAAHYRLGQALARRGQTSEARPHLDRAEAIRLREALLILALDRLIRGARDPDTFERLGGLCRDAGLMAEARAWFEEAIRLDPTRPSAQAALAGLVVPPEPAVQAPHPRVASVPPVSPAAPVLGSGLAPRFEDVARRAGIDFQYDCGARGDLFLGDTMGGGVGLIDYDDDGWLDLYLVNGCRLPYDRQNPPAPNRLYRNRRDGTFEDVTARVGVGGRGYGMGCAVGDYDNDGHDDLFVTGLGATVLYRNRGDGTFEDVTARAGVQSNRWTTAAGFGDLDRDGDLDLVAVTYVDADPLRSPACKDSLGKPIHCPPGQFTPQPDHLFRNNGDGTFTDVTREAGLDVPNGVGLGLAIADFDDDGRLDLFIANDAAPNFLFRNQGGLKFAEIGVSSGAAYDGTGRATASMGVVADDLDGDGRIDLFHTNFHNEPNTLLKNLGGNQFLDVTARANLDAPSRPMTGFGTAALDVDNDGLLDLFVANGHVDDRPWDHNPMAQSPQLFRATAAGRFELSPATAAPYFARTVVGRGSAAGDLDNDGRVDLVVVHRDAPVAVLQNQTPGGHWIGIKLRGGKPGRTPVGARVTCRVGGRTSVRWLTSGTNYLGANDPRLFFGLGRARLIDNLEVRWLSGRIQSWERLPTDRILEIREGEDELIPLR